MLRNIILCAVLSVLSFVTSAKALNIVVGLDKPPYVIQSENSGFELEMIRALFAELGHQTHFIFVPFGRSVKMLDSEGVDAIMTMNVSVVDDVNNLSHPYITYQNVVVTNKNHNLQIEDFSDLSKVGVVSFQNARNLLGADFKRAVMFNSNYMEIAQQQAQVELFLTGKVDAIVIDKNIYHYFVSRSRLKINEQFHNLFQPTKYGMAFKDLKLKQAFNKKLKSFLLSDKYQSIVDDYQLYIDPDQVR